MSTLIKKKKKRNSPVKSGNPKEPKVEALMPGLLHLCEWTMQDMRHRETGNTKVIRNNRKQSGIFKDSDVPHRRDVEAAERAALLLLEGSR